MIYPFPTHSHPPMESLTEPDKAWFVMRDLKRPNAKLPAYRQLSDAGFEVFTPLMPKIMTRGTKRVKESVPVIHDLLFVNSTRSFLDPVVARTDTLQYRYVKGGGYCDPLVVPTQDMERFIHAVESGARVDYYRPDEIPRSMYGSRIRIIDDGPLNGYEGILLTVRGSKKRRVLVELPGILTAAIEVVPDFIQPL